MIKIVEGEILSDFSVQARQVVRGLRSSLIREVADSAMGQHDVLPFWFGESDQPTPKFIREAGVNSILSGETFYSQNLGRPYLRNAIAEYLSSLHGTHIDYKRVVITGSGVSALMINAQLLIDPGDRVVAVTPLWPNLIEIIKVLGGNVTTVPLEVIENSWELDVDKLLFALGPTTKVLVINSPNNPTGWTIRPEQLQTVLEHCRKHGIWILCDDVYERLVYAPEMRSAPSFLAAYQDGDRIISVNSFSKAWSMTGWRIGWTVVPEVLTPMLEKLIEYNTSCVPEPTQRAAFTAVTQGEALVMENRKKLAMTRSLLVEGLSALPGVTVPEAGGAMYAFFKISGREDSTAFAKQLVTQYGLGLAPGEAFGKDGLGWLRWCHAVEPSKLLLGLQRIREALIR